MPTLLKLACVDIAVIEAEAFAVGASFLLVLLGLTLVSYSCIASAVTKNN